jgi:hypothetical protein
MLKSMTGLGRGAQVSEGDAEFALNRYCDFNVN